MKHNDAQIFLFFLNLIAVAIVVQIQDTKERAGIFLTKGNTTRHVFSFENAYVLCVFALCAHLNHQSGGVFIEFYGGNYGRLLYCVDGQKRMVSKSLKILLLSRNTMLLMSILLLSVA